MNALSRAVLFIVAAFSLIVIAIAPLRAAEPAPAQIQPLSEEQIQAFSDRIEKARQRMQLSDEQETALTPIITESVRERAAVLQRYGFSRENRPDLNFRQKLSLRKEMDVLHHNTNEQVAKILTEEQMREWRKIQEEARAHMRDWVLKRDSANNGE